jgi:hypothetical protein
MTTEYQHLRLSTPADIQHLAPRHRGRRYRAHAVFALILILALTFVTLQAKDVVSSKLRPTSHAEFNGDFGSISPFAKKKVFRIS